MTFKSISRRMIRAFCWGQPVLTMTDSKFQARVILLAMLPRSCDTSSVRYFHGTAQVVRRLIAPDHRCAHNIEPRLHGVCTELDAFNAHSHKRRVGMNRTHCSNTACIAGKQQGHEFVEQSLPPGLASQLSSQSPRPQARNELEVRLSVEPEAILLNRHLLLRVSTKISFALAGKHTPQRLGRA